MGGLVIRLDTRLIPIPLEHPQAGDKPLSTSFGGRKPLQSDLISSFSDRFHRLVENQTFKGLAWRTLALANSQLSHFLGNMKIVCKNWKYHINDYFSTHWLRVQQFSRSSELTLHGIFLIFIWNTLGLYYDCFRFESTGNTTNYRNSICIVGCFRVTGKNLNKHSQNENCRNMFYLLSISSNSIFLLQTKKPHLEYFVNFLL